MYATAVLRVCSFGPWADVSSATGTISGSGASGSLYIENRRDLLKHTTDKELPSYETAAEVLKLFAEYYGYTVLSEDLLRTQFDGLNVYFFGSREPLDIQDLLFYWQD